MFSLKRKQHRNFVNFLFNTLLELIPEQLPEWISEYVRLPESCLHFFLITAHLRHTFILNLTDRVIRQGQTFFILDPMEMMPVKDFYTYAVCLG